MRKEILDNTIIGHRILINERYQYQTLIKNYKLPVWLTEERIDDLRNYFLEFVYPSIERRAELDDAFESLDNHIRNPQHLLQIFLDSGSLIFKYGRQLPKILMAGLKAMTSFKSASRLERKMAEVAEKENTPFPYSSKTIEYLMSKISRKYIDDLLDSTTSLYEILNDQKLVDKIISVVNSLIDKMAAKRNVYSDSEIRGIELGRDIILGSKNLFYQFPKEERDQLIMIIQDIERDAVEIIYKS